MNFVFGILYLFLLVLLLKLRIGEEIKTNYVYNLVEKGQSSQHSLVSLFSTSRVSNDNASTGHITQFSEISLLFSVLFSLLKQKITFTHKKRHSSIIIKPTLLNTSYFWFGQIHCKTLWILCTENEFMEMLSWCNLEWWHMHASCRWSQGQWIVL